MMLLDQRVMKTRPNNVIIIEEIDIEAVKQQMQLAFNQ